METLLNTDFFFIVSNCRCEQNSEKIFLAYKNFAKTILEFLQNSGDNKTVFFLLNFIRIELLAIQKVKSNSKTVKKTKLSNILIKPY